MKQPTEVFYNKTALKIYDNSADLQANTAVMM